MLIERGSNVRLSNYGREDYFDCEANPHNLIGVLLREDITREDTSVTVRWSNGFNNYYSGFHLIKVTEEV